MSTMVSHEWPAEFNRMPALMLCPRCHAFKEGVKRVAAGVMCEECAALSAAKESS